MCTKKRVLYVTVGTTQFDDLVCAIDTIEFLLEMKKYGYLELVVQIGRGNFVPKNTIGNQVGIQVKYYRYSNDYLDDMKRADLIISHAGAGSIMDALSLSKPLIAVVNTTLMNNHQVELAEALKCRNHILVSDCTSLIQSIATLDTIELTDYPDIDSRIFPNVVDKLMGFPFSTT